MTKSNSRRGPVSGRNKVNVRQTLAVLFIVGCVLVIAGPLIIAGQIRKTNRAEGNSKWPSVKGMIINSELVRTNSSDGGKGRMRRYRSRLTYKYAVAGREYVGNRYSFDVVSFRDDESLAGSFPIGKKVDVYYDPGNPKNCVLKKGEVRAETFWLVFGFGTLLSLSGCGMLGLIVWKSKWRVSSVTPRDQKCATFDSKKTNLGFPRFSMRVGIFSLLLLVSLYFYYARHLPPPVIRELRDRGNVVDFADEDSEIGKGERPSWRDPPTNKDRQIHKMRMFVVEDLEPLANRAQSLTNLERLDLSETEISDLSPLTDLKSLKRLDLRGTHVANLLPLTGLTNLELLTLTDTQTVDLSTLENLHQLSSLYLTNTPVNDLRPLAALTKLSAIAVDHTPISDLTPLAVLPNLTTVSVDHAQVRDLSPLTGLPKLERLAIDERQFRGNLSVLANLKKLTVLDLRHAEVTDSEVEDLQNALPSCHILR